MEMRRGLPVWCYGAVLALVVGPAALLRPATTRAQAWLADRRYSQGPGVMLSDSMVLHLGVAVEGGYDTNVFYLGQDELGAGRVRATPQIELATLPPQRTENPDGTVSEASRTADFFVNVAAIYNQYVATGDRSDVVMEQSDVAIQSALGLTVFPKRPWGFVLRNTFSRTIDPPNEVSPTNYNRDYGDAELGIRWTPGAGAFELNLLAGLSFNLYEQGGDISRIGDYLSPRGEISGRWKFYPNTALTFETEFAPVIMIEGNGGTTPCSPPYCATPGPSYIISSSYPIRSWLGFNGQWTPVIATALRVGYGAAFYDLGDDFDSIIAQAEVGFIVSPAARIKVGFIRDFVDSYFSNYYVRNQGYIRWDQTFAGSFLLAAQVNLRYLQYSMLRHVDGTAAGSGEVSMNPRDDVRLDGSLFFEYRARDWLAFNATADLEYNITDFRWEVTAIPAGARAEEYWKLMVFGGARFIY